MVRPFHRRQALGAQTNRDDRKVQPLGARPGPRDRKQQKAANKYWRIAGQKKFGTFFDVRIPVGSITEDRLKDLLRCLTARANNFPSDDIVGAYQKKRTHDFQSRDLVLLNRNSCSYEDAQL
jgi:hypothetical protein